MPCQGPSAEEEALHRKYLEKLKDPVFLEEQAKLKAENEYQWKNGGQEKYRKKKEFELQIEDSLKRERNNNKIANLIKKSDLEEIAFNSFMSVFLCKAMELIVSNNLMAHTYADMEWWWEEHKYRDNNNDKSSVSKEELYKKLYQINNQFKVI